MCRPVRKKTIGSNAATTSADPAIALARYSPKDPRGTPVEAPLPSPRPPGESTGHLLEHLGHRGEPADDGRVHRILGAVHAGSYSA